MHLKEEVKCNRAYSYSEPNRTFLSVFSRTTSMQFGTFVETQQILLQKHLLLSFAMQMSTVSEGCSLEEPQKRIILVMSAPC